MKRIGGNCLAKVQIKSTRKNEIGERVSEWKTVQELKGYIDMMSGNSDYDTYNAKVTESTHIFVCDYIPLIQKITAENSRLIVNGESYTITYIDNPMNLNYQLEISLKYTGGIVNG